MLRRSLAALPAATIRRTASATFARVAAVAVARAPASVSVRTITTVPSRFSAEEASHSDFAPVSKQRVSAGLEDAKAQIARDISTHSVFLYMKGTPAQPRCGFSANVVKILNSYAGVKYGSRDVLEDEYVREAIKQFSDWPTLPQLFVNGEFVGGSDIVGNMYKSGELDKLLGATTQQQKA